MIDTLPNMQDVLAQETARKNEEVRQAAIAAAALKMEQDAKIGTIEAVVYAMSDYLRLGLGMAGQAMARGWQGHWDNDLLPDMSWLCQHIGTTDTKEASLDNLHTLAVLQTIAVEAANAGPDGQAVAKAALARAVRQALPYGYEYKHLAALVAETVVTNELLSADDYRLTELATSYGIENRKVDTWVNSQRLVRQTFQQAWANAVNRLDEHATEHDYCSEYEQAMETIRDLCDTPYLAEPDRVTETETEVLITYTTTHTVQVTVTHPSDTEYYDYVDADDYTHLVDLGDGEVTDTDFESTY